MAEFVRLTQMYSQCRKNRKGTGRVKEIIKEGMFNIAEFGNWLTGFKQDEVAHGSRVLTELHTPKVSPRRRYF